MEKIIVGVSKGHYSTWQNGKHYHSNKTHWIVFYYEETGYYEGVKYYSIKDDGTVCPMVFKHFDTNLLGALWYKLFIKKQRIKKF